MEAIVKNGIGSGKLLQVLSGGVLKVGVDPWPHQAHDFGLLARDIGYGIADHTSGADEVKRAFTLRCVWRLASQYA